MTATHAFNIIIIILGLISVWTWWRNYRLLPSSAFIIVALTMAYLTVYRVALPRYPWMTAYGVALPVYVGMGLSGIILHKTLMRVLRGPRRQQEQLDIRVKDCYKLNKFDYTIVSFIVLILVIVMVLEIYEICN